MNRIRKLALEDGRFSPEAFQFLYEGLDRAVRMTGRAQAEGSDRHVSGEELLSGMVEYAKELFGPLAAHVWRTWGIREPIDWGRVVFLLVDRELLNRQEGDTLEDFRLAIDFDEVFVDSYKPHLPPELGARPDPEVG